MHYYLELALVSALFITALLTFGHFLHRKRNPSKQFDLNRLPWYIDYARSFFPVILLVVVLRSFVAEPFRIPSSSMEPSLLPGDLVLVNKFSYGVKLPLTHATVIPLGKPETGDIVVFKYPLDERVNYIKRLIGKPGDKISYRDKQLFINDEQVATDLIERLPGQGYTIDAFTEELPGKTHDIHVIPQAANKYQFTDIVVPEGQYFVMGDNRDNSNDSRVWGFVPEENMLGKAMFIWMHVYNWKIRFERIGSID